MESPYRKTTEDQQSLKKGVSDFQAFLDGIKIIGSKVFYYCSFIVLVFLFGFIYHLIALVIDLPRKFWDSAIRIGHKVNGIESKRQFKWFSLLLIDRLVKEASDLRNFNNLIFCAFLISSLGTIFWFGFVLINLIDDVVLIGLMTAVFTFVLVLMSTFLSFAFDSYYKKLKKLS